MSSITANVVKKVLETWADSFIEEVPALHRNGQYLIEYDTLVEHLSTMSAFDHVKIALEIDEREHGV